MEDTIAPDGAIAHGPYCRFLSGEVDALNEIWNHDCARMRAIAAEYLEGWQHLEVLCEPDDFFQETFLRLIERPVNRTLVTRGECEREFWRIFRTVLHQAISEQSDRQCALKRGGEGIGKADDGEPGRSVDGERRWVGIAPDEAMPIASNHPGPEALVAGQELVERFLEQLGAEGATIVRLRLDGHTIAEIAEKTGRHPRSIEKRLMKFRCLWDDSSPV